MLQRLKRKFFNGLWSLCSICSFLISLSYMPVMSKKYPSIVAVLGAGNFGTAIAQVLAENGHRVHLWNWEQEHEPLQQIEKYQENKRYLPGIKLLKRIVPTYQIGDALRGAEVVFLAVPSSAMDNTLSFAGRHIGKKTIIVNVSKGFDLETREPMSCVISRHLPPALRKQLVTVSGPAVANQLVAHHVTIMNVASKNQHCIDRVHEILGNPFLRLVETTDILGVEVGGLCKNVYAVGFGMCDGLGVELNMKAALVTVAVREMAAAMRALGGKSHTAYELAGLGDLIGTGFNKTSRNCRFGTYLGQGHTTREAHDEIKQTVEGVNASACLHWIEAQHKLSLPFADAVYRAIHTKADPVKVMQKYLSGIYR